MRLPSPLPRESTCRLRLLLGMLVLFFGVYAPSLRAQEKTPEQSTYVTKGYRLVWSDEFNGKTLDTKKWQYRQLGKRDNAVIAKEAVILDGKGFLQLTTFKKDDTIHSG